MALSGYGGVRFIAYACRTQACVVEPGGGIWPLAVSGSSWGFGEIMRVRAAVLFVLSIVAGLGWVALPAPALADTAPPAGTPSTVSADALPTWQINGVVWSAGRRGQHWSSPVAASPRRDRPVSPPAAPVRSTANNFFAYDITTGNRVAAFSHSFNGEVLTVKASPDGSTRLRRRRLHHGRRCRPHPHRGVRRDDRRADPPSTPRSTAPCRPSQRPTHRLRRWQVQQRRTASRAPDWPRSRRPTARCRPWDPSADNLVVTAWSCRRTSRSSSSVAASPPSTARPASGMGAVDATTGGEPALGRQHQDHQRRHRVRHHQPLHRRQPGLRLGLRVRLRQLRGHVRRSTSTPARSTGPTTATATPTTRSRSAACSTRVSHAHNCSTIGGFFQSDPWSINMRHALAFTTNPTGTNTGPDDYGWDYNGVPSSKLLQWYPDVSARHVHGPDPGRLVGLRQQQLRRRWAASSRR